MKMRKELLLVLFLFLPAVNADWIYQENPNSASSSSDANFNIGHEGNKAYDGDWSTYSQLNSWQWNAYMYMNYTLLNGASEVKWTFKDDTATYNKTLSSGCVNSTIRIMEEFAALALPHAGYYMYSYCWNYSSSSWVNIHTQVNHIGTVFYDEGVYFSVNNTLVLLLDNSSRSVNATWQYPINVTCQSSGSVSLYLNGTPISNYAVHDLSAGYYNFSCNNSANYTSLFFNLSKVLSNVSLSVNPSSILEGQESVLTCSGSDSPLLFFDGVLQVSPFVAGSLTVGSYAVVCNYSGDENHTSASTSGTLVVGDLCVGSFSPEFVELGVLLVLLFGFLIMISRPFMSKDDFTGYALKLVLLFLALVFVLYYVANWNSIC